MQQFMSQTVLALNQVFPADLNLPGDEPNKDTPSRHDQRAEQRPP